MTNLMPPGSATQEGALREFACEGTAQVPSASSSFSQTTFMESVWVLLFRNLLAGRIGKALFVS